LLKKLPLLEFQRMRPSPPGNMRSKFIEPESSTAMMKAGVARVCTFIGSCASTPCACAANRVCAR